jgi:hypothetical protein
MFSSLYGLNYMGIFKTILILLIASALSACGGESSNSSEVLFPAYLPQENMNLSQNTRSGIWMVYRTIKTTYVSYEDGIKYESFLQSTENGISVLDLYNAEISTLPFCTVSDMFEQFELDITPTKTGYSQSYSLNPNNSSVTSKGSLDITFINNRKLTGKGHREYTYTDASRHESTTIYAVKISDDSALITSSNLSYSSNIETESELAKDVAAICIALSNFDAEHYRDGEKTSDDHVQYAQLFGLDDRDLQGIEVFKTKGSSGEDDYQRMGGIYYNGKDYDPWRKNILCPLEDNECLSQDTLNLNIIKNDNTGIVFNTRLNIHDGSFLNSDVSVIFNSTTSKE